MTKILVLSDSHRSFDILDKIYEKEMPDVVIGAGDTDNDIESLSYAHPHSRYISVTGNCDAFSCMRPINDITTDIAGYKFYITHGHIYKVKSTLDYILQKAISIDANIVIFGHTHVPMSKNILNISLFNPGAAMNGKYGMITITDDKVMFSLRSLVDQI